jgi:hypothetical protein
MGISQKIEDYRSKIANIEKSLEAYNENVLGVNYIFLNYKRLLIKILRTMRS